MTITNPNDPWRYCPQHMLETFRDYVNKGVRPQGFALALLENDLVEALLTADRVNYTNLQNYVMFLKAAMPKGSYGTKEAVAAWLAKGGKGKVEPVKEVVNVKPKTRKNTGNTGKARKPRVPKSPKPDTGSDANPDQGTRELAGIDLVHPIQAGDASD